LPVGDESAEVNSFLTASRDAPIDGDAERRASRVVAFGLDGWQRLGLRENERFNLVSKPGNLMDARDQMRDRRPEPFFH
jgi:hypothetical protein